MLLNSVRLRVRNRLQDQKLIGSELLARVELPGATYSRGWGQKLLVPRSATFRKLERITKAHYERILEISKAKCFNQPVFNPLNFEHTGLAEATQNLISKQSTRIARNIKEMLK